MSRGRTAKRRSIPAKQPRQRVSGIQSKANSEAALARAGELHNAGDLASAAAMYAELIAADPDNHRATFLLGLLEHQRGEHARSRVQFERLMQIAEQNPYYTLWFARVLRAAGDTPAALDRVRRCRELSPRDVPAMDLESQLLLDCGQVAAAVDVMRAGVVEEPDNVHLWARLGAAQLSLGDVRSARTSLEAAIERDGSRHEVWLNLGVALQRAGERDAATLAFEQSLRLNPDNAEGHYNFSVALDQNHCVERAIEHARRALALDPDRPEWLTGLAGILTEVGEPDEAAALFRRGLALAPRPREHTTLVSLQQYLPVSCETRLREARAWAALYAPERSASAAPSSRSLRPRRPTGAPVRVGYVSGDFRRHAVSYFFEPLLAAHDRKRVELTCYSSSSRRDEVTVRFEQLARMRCIAELSDDQAAAQIRDDGIDVLVDLSGHTNGHRLSLFALQCAPVQLSYLGYPGTTGVPGIHWRITDGLVDPAPFADQCYTERLYRLGRTFCTYLPPDATPEVAPLPAMRAGRVTFGSLNNYTKVTAEVLDVWAEVLTRIPDSRLILQSRVFADPTCRERVGRRFARHGVAPERLELHGMMPLAQHVRLYEQIDIGLDTFPWNGHTTTCLALHMGVPVLTLEGRAGAARLGASVLSALGLTDWISGDRAAYVASAERWAGDLSALASLRSQLRQRLARSELCDARGLARAIEAAYLTLAGADDPDLHSALEHS